MLLIKNQVIRAPSLKEDDLSMMIVGRTPDEMYLLVEVVNGFRFITINEALNNETGTHNYVSKGHAIVYFLQQHEGSTVHRVYQNGTSVKIEVVESEHTAKIAPGSSASDNDHYENQ